MDRRATLSTLLGKQDFKVNSGIDTYSGEWGFKQAAHLLRRTTFGPTKADIMWSVENGLKATIDKLFEAGPMPEPPINYEFQEDPNVPIGETWIYAPYSRTINLRGYRHRSLRAWTYELMRQDGISLREQMTLFWHNHFAISNVNDPRYLYRHITLCRNNVWGNFRDLIKEVTVDPAMLRFLNGNQNSEQAPNENYARELLELFTIGKGDLAGPGDYTNYTEDDVIEIAKVLTGWRDIGFNSANPEIEVGVIFRPGRHDTTTKQLSHRFDNVEIPNMGNREYAHLIDIIFSKEEVARFISRKLYRWFVYYKIDAETESAVIDAMAKQIINDDYNLENAIRSLLSSEHFFDILNVGPMIKNPNVFMLGLFRQFEVDLPDDIAQRYNITRLFQGQSRLMQMEYFNPPDVAGWKAYYQEPGFYRTWINSSTLPSRVIFASRISRPNGWNIRGFRVKIDPLKFLDKMDHPEDPNLLVEEMTRLLLPQPLTEEQYTGLKEVLIPGLPDYVWGEEYSEYALDPDNEMLAEAIADKVRAVIQVILSLPEFHLS